jgi:predicted permease
MITARETTSALYGAYRLARADKGGMGYFNASAEGFWRSFYAAALVAPLYAILLATRYKFGDIEAPGLRFIAVESIAYVTAWVAFPLVVAHLAPMIDRGHRFLGYIVAYNWASVLQNLVCLPVAVFIDLGVVSPSFATFAGLGCFILVTAYIWYITRVALDVSGFLAAAFTFLDIVLSVLIHGYADGMLH